MSAEESHERKHEKSDEHEKEPEMKHDPEADHNWSERESGSGSESDVAAQHVARPERTWTRGADPARETTA